MSNFPKHIQEAATPLTDKLELEQECNFDVSWEDHARNLERLTIWQQEILDKAIKALPDCKFQERADCYCARCEALFLHAQLKSK